MGKRTISQDPSTPQTDRLDVPSTMVIINIIDHAATGRNQAFFAPRYSCASSSLLFLSFLLFVSSITNGNLYTTSYVHPDSLELAFTSSFRGLSCSSAHPASSRSSLLFLCLSLLLPRPPARVSGASFILSLLLSLFSVVEKVPLFSKQPTSSSSPPSPKLAVF